MTKNETTVTALRGILATLEKSESPETKAALRAQIDMDKRHLTKLEAAGKGDCWMVQTSKKRIAEYSEMLGEVYEASAPSPLAAVPTAPAANGDSLEAAIAKAAIEGVAKGAALLASGKFVAQQIAPSPRANTAASIATLESAGKFEEAYALLPRAKQAEFLDAKNYAAFCRRRGQIRYISRVSEAPVEENALQLDTTKRNGFLEYCEALWAREETRKGFGDLGFNTFAASVWCSAVGRRFAQIWGCSLREATANRQ